MAWIEKLPSGRWRGCYRDRKGKAGKVRYTEGTYDRKPDALTEAEKIEKRVRRSKGRSIEKVTIAELAEKWFAPLGPHILKPKTIASYRSLLDSRVLRSLGDEVAGELTSSDVGAWVADMAADGVGPSRIRQAVVVLKMVLDSAIRDGYLEHNITEGARLPRLEHKEPEWFEPHIVDSLVDALGEPYGALVAVLGVCGLRFGEGVALRRRHIDGLRRRLLVQESLAEINGALIFGTPKSHARRSVPLSPNVMALLDTALADKGPKDLVFTSPEGQPVRYRNFLSRVWHPLLERLELPVVGVHVLRHSAAARMISAGASAKTLQTILGHKSAAFSYTVYGHLMDTDLDALAERLDTPHERNAAQ